MLPSIIVSLLFLAVFLSSTHINAATLPKPNDMTTQHTTGTTLLSINTPFGVVMGSDTRTSSNGYVVNSLSEKVTCIFSKDYRMNLKNDPRGEGCFWGLAIMRTGVTKGTKRTVKVVEDEIEEWFRRKLVSELRLVESPIVGEGAPATDMQSTNTLIQPYPTLTVRTLVPILKAAFKSLPSDLASKVRWSVGMVLRTPFFNIFLPTSPPPPPFPVFSNPCALS